PLCSGKQFGAEGPLYGFVSANIAAYDQRLPLALLLVLAAIAGTVIALGVGSIARKRVGLFAHIKEVES
ncbi:MAG: hypothetical protein ABI882_24235, partial [Acidobacteriota bacterium]